MKYNIICEICSKKSTVSYKQQKTCSRECGLLRKQRITGRYSCDTTIPSGTVGAISELEISSDLMKKGYSIFRSLSPSCFCDIVAIKNEKILKIEIRTGYMTNKEKIFFPRKKHGEIDLFGIYERNLNKCFYFDKKYKKIEII